MVYIFVALAALGVGATAYFGLAFTPAEAILAAAVFGCIAVVALERTLRHRAENRLEKAIEDLSRLLSTDAQAGAVLSQRVNQLSDENAGRRLEMVEADISVLGTVIRQVAEAVAEIEEGQGSPGPRRRRSQTPQVAEVEPVVPLETVREAIAGNRLLLHVQPVLTLPQRRVHGYDLVPRLMLEDGDIAGPAEFLPRRGGADIRRDVDGAALVEAITVARRARANGQPLTLFVPLSRATLADRPSVEQLLATLDANRTIAEGLVFLIGDDDWQALADDERVVLGRIARTGATFSLDAVRSLRFDVAAAAENGMHSLRVDTTLFLSDPQALTDFHASDVASYLARFGVDLMVTGVTGEQQLLELLEDGVTLVQGPHMGAPVPIRPDLMSERPRASAQLRRVEG